MILFYPPSVIQLVLVVGKRRPRFRVEIKWLKTHHHMSCLTQVHSSVPAPPLHTGKEQKSNGNDSKQLDVIISETVGGGNGYAMRRHRQSLLLRVGKREEEKRARKGMMAAPLAGRPAAFGSKLQWQAEAQAGEARRPPLSSLSLSF